MPTTRRTAGPRAGTGAKSAASTAASPIMSSMFGPLEHEQGRGWLANPRVWSCERQGIPGRCERKLVVDGIGGVESNFDHHLADSSVR
jgi:hypothetical protein